MKAEHKNKCILVSVGYEEIKPRRIIKPKINIDYDLKKITLNYLTGKVLFNGVGLWREYELKSKNKGVVFGVVNSIGDRMDNWCKHNYYIAIRKKDKKILSVLHQDYFCRVGFKYSDWKKEVLENEKIT